RELESAGIEVIIGHEARTIDRVQPDVVVISTAIPETNPELVRARELGIEVAHRAKMLSALSANRRTVAVAGTHGKTTTSSMIATMLDSMDLEPSFLIGGIVEGYNSNAKNGTGDIFVAEADESDGSFLYLDPDLVVVTNIEADHLDHYGSLAEIEDAFVKLIESVGEEGCAVVCGETSHLVEVANRSGRRIITYGMDPSCDYTLIPGEPTGTIESHCTIECPSGERVEVALHSNPGIHNLLNACAAIAVAEQLGGDAADAARALSAFKGVRRRFTHVGDVAGITIVDDYGHHPTEIQATLKAAKGLGFKRLVVVFQPHRYTRTAALADQFADAFADADVLIMMDVFSAGEMPIPGVTGKALSSRVEKAGHGTSVSYAGRRPALLQKLAEECREGDLLITMGAGDVTGVGPDFIGFMREREDA
ncbi:MAG: UDP-N-acetylmuramate--L-alanine ligase, partial [Atopobiaceae bacterium]|nr:UDP-N-acetylmuramate--L-alanine ligase [Atopobiaceae bacterium]